MRAAETVMWGVRGSGQAAIRAKRAHTMATSFENTRGLRSENMLCPRKQDGPAFREFEAVGGPKCLENVSIVPLHPLKGFTGPAWGVLGRGGYQGEMSQRFRRRVQTRSAVLECGWSGWCGVAAGRQGSTPTSLVSGRCARRWAVVVIRRRERARGRTAKITHVLERARSWPARGGTETSSFILCARWERAGAGAGPVEGSGESR